MKTISKIPFRREIEEEARKVIMSVTHANYAGFFSVFVYTNIALYFLYMAHRIFF